MRLKQAIGVLSAGFFFLFAVMAGNALAQSAGKRVALVVGNGTYRTVDRLTNPANDAKLIARTLQTAGFTLVGGGVQLDLDKAHFDRAVQDFGRAVQGADVALFYYSGHGMQVRGTNWLVPVDANPTGDKDLDFQMVDAGLVLHQMEGAGTKLNLVILDACRNNPFAVRGVRGSQSGLAEMHAPEGTLISYATQPGNVASDGSSGDSPYTKALAEAIRRPGLDMFQVFNQVGLAVKQETAGNQQPWLASSPISGNFYFFNGPVTIAPGPAADPETVFWQSISSSGNPADYQAYLRRFPTGTFADLAKQRIATGGNAGAGNAGAPRPEATAGGTWRGEIRCDTLPGMTTLKLIGDFEILADGAQIVYKRFVHNPDSTSTSGVAESGQGTLTAGEMKLQGGASGKGYSYSATYQGQVKGSNLVMTGEQIWVGATLTTQPFHRQCQILLARN